jgi:hypothetical protein
MRSEGDKELCTSIAVWILVTENGNKIWDAESLADGKSPTDTELEEAPFWTDQHHNLVSVLRAW